MDFIFEPIFFSKAFSLAFVASLPPSLVGLSLMETLQHHPRKKTLLFFALGAASVDLVHISLALFIHYKWMGGEVFQIWARPVFAVLAALASFWLWQRHPAPAQMGMPKTNRLILMNGLNLMAIVFWIGVVQFWPAAKGAFISLSTGIFLGTFVCLSLYSLAGRVMRNFYVRFPHLGTRLLALALAGISIFQFSIWVNQQFKPKAGPETETAVKI